MAERIIDRDSIEMFENDMSKYSIVVNRRRSIPAIQDGLKPVQRRVIFGAYKDHLTKPSLKDKSASLVGTVMKSYHPHGDCQRGNTNVYLLNGQVKNLKELFEDGQSVEILSVDPSTLKVVPAVAHSFRIGQYTNKVYHIVFSNGYEIQCTNNHPFMLPNGAFIKAENIAPYTRLLVKDLYLGISSERKCRPRIDKNLIQNIVCDYYFGPLEEGYERHHLDFNTMNNSPSNLKVLTTRDHILLHREDPEYRETYDVALEKGRYTMFGDDLSSCRLKMERKNSILTQLFNKEQGIRRFKYAIKILNERNIEITEDNYEALRQEGIIYNLPIVSRLISKHPEYNCKSFEDLVNLELPSIGELYDERMSTVRQMVSFDTQCGNRTTRYQIPINVVNIINSVIDNQLPYTVDSYIKCTALGKSSVDAEIISRYMETYKHQYPFVMNIWIEDVNNEPMYDFTVDGLENMLIPIGDLNNPFLVDTSKVVPMISIHNSSIYDTIATLVAWYKTKYPLFYGKGNWGSCAGDKQAAQRYTECALSNFGYDVLVDELTQSGNVVDWLETYKRNGDKEPEYLPSKLPLLLINGSFGLGVGMQINIPSHNLSEVIDATIALIKNPNSKITLIPDLPQGCDLFAGDWSSISNSGRGSFKCRGRIITEKDSKGNYTLHIISLPDQVTCNKVYDKICEMIAAKQLPMIRDIFNATDKKTERPDIIIHLKQGSDPEYVKQVIFAKTPVQQTVSVNFEAVSSDGINIARYSYKAYLLEFIKHRCNIKFRLYCNKLQQAMTREMHVDAYIKVIGSKDLDKIIAMIRKYTGDDQNVIIEYMIKNCGLTDIQAKFIIDRTLGQLSKAHYNKYIQEHKELVKTINTYMKYVSDSKQTLILQEIEAELLTLKAKYGTPRLCKVIKNADADDIPSGTFKVVITEKNFIRKIPDNDKVGVVRKDNPKFIVRVDNAENILIFDNKGKVFNLPVHKIPISDRTSAGTDVRMLVRTLTSDIAAVFYEPLIGQIHKSGNKHYLAVLTKSNTIKKLDLEDFLNVSPSGLMYSKIRPEDEVVGVTIVPHNLDIAISSGQKVLRCKFKDVPLYKRNASGVRAMNTNEPINGLSVFYPDSKEIVAITKKGKVNKFDIALLECNNRGKQGHKVIKLDANDEILNVFGVNESDVIRVLTSDSVEEIKVSDIKKGKSHLAAGIKMVKSNSVIIRADVMKTM